MRLISLIFLSGLSHDDVMILFHAVERYFAHPVYHRNVPRVHDISHGFVSIVSFSYFKFYLT